MPAKAFGTSCWDGVEMAGTRKSEAGVGIPRFTRRLLCGLRTSASIKSLCNPCAKYEASALVCLRRVRRSPGPFVNGCARRRGSGERSFHGQHGAGGLAHDRFGHTAHQHLIQSGSPVRAHHDQVCSRFLSHPKDLASGVSGFQAVFHLNSGVRCLVPAKIFPKIDVMPQLNHLRYLPPVDKHGRRGDVHDNQAGADVPGQRAGQLEGVLGTLREICWVEDRVNGPYRLVLSSRRAVASQGSLGRG